MILTNEKLPRAVSEDASLEEAPKIIQLLEQELAASGKRGAPGIGLSAPQIGILKRVAIIRIPKTPTSAECHLNLVNIKPEDITGFDKFIFDGEGCLSFPGLQERTWRYQEIYVQNNAVTPHSFILTGLPAVAVQHEQDHLDGITFTTRRIGGKK